MARILMIVAAAAIAAPAFAQDIAYEKYRLNNGLTVILHEDHALPVVAVNLWYRVGAQNEPKGRSGFAHLFEHLMFMGTERVRGNDFDNIMEAGGGANNASTSLDRTNYFSNGPSSLLPTLLWLEADRIEDLGRTMTKEKLDRQRDVVRNEIRQNVENTPYGRLDEYTARYVFPEGHPYHWNVYGLHEDLEAATVDNVKDFFATFYVPRNCSLVVAGDFDTAKVKPLIESLFSSLAAGAAPPRVDADAVPKPSIPKTFGVTMLDKVDLPRLRSVWLSPPHFAEGDAELDLVAAVLAEGKSSRLYKRLVLDEKLATDVSASQDSAVLGSMFVIDITTPPGVDLDRVQRVADEELARLAREGPTEQELEQRKATIELGMLARIETMGSLADRLNEYQYFFDEPNSFKRDLERYRRATPAAVKQWAATLSPEHRFMARVLPEEPERQPSARDKRPDDFAPPAFTPPPPQTFRLGGGLPVMLWTRKDLPLVSVELIIPGAAGAAPPEKSGLAYLTARMLGEGAGDLDTVRFADAVQSLGFTFGSGADRQAFTVSLSGLKRNLDKALPLMADAVRRPRMTAEDFERVKRLHLEQLEQDMNDPMILGQRVFLRTLFGDTHPYAWPPEGTPPTIERLTLEDVKACYASSITPAGATLLVSGDITADEARSLLDRSFGDWTSPAKRPPVNIPPPPPQAGLRVYLIDRPGAVQTVIRFASPAPAATDPLRPSLSVLNTLFGGSFTSRLNQNIREQHGYAYGAASRFALLPGAGYFVASSSVKTDVTGPALKEFLNEFSRLRGGPIGANFVAAPTGDISEAELAKATETLRTDAIQAFQGHAGPLAAAAERIAQGLSYETIGQDLAALKTVTAAGLNRAARDATPLERGVLLLIGDKGTVLEQIKDLGLPAPVELAPNGEPVER